LSEKSDITQGDLERIIMSDEVSEADLEEILNSEDEQSASKHVPVLGHDPFRYEK
jgi:collagenase-like PrtC family protease